MRIPVINLKYGDGRYLSNAVKSLYSGHHRDLEKLSAMKRCLLLPFSQKK